MNCLIVDDEPQTRQLLVTFLAGIPGYIIAGAFGNAIKAFDALQTGKIDLLLLDNRMPVISGNDFLRSLKNPPLVIFTTVSEHYAKEGYEHHVVDYLSKPVALPHLQQAVEKAGKWYKERLLAPHEPQVDYTFVKQHNKLVKVMFRDIHFVEGLHNNIKIHLTNSAIVASTTIKAFERILPPSQFIRVHRSYIASVSFITAIRNGQIALSSLPLSADISNKDDLLKSLGK